MSQHESSHNPEFVHQAEALQLADRANVDPQLLEGTRYEELSGGKDREATFDVRKMQDIDGQGLIAIIGAGNTALRLHAFGEGSDKNLYLTPGKIEEVVEGKQQVVSMVPVDPGSSRWFGRDLPYKTKLGLAGDDAISRSHFSLELSHEGQLTVSDLSSNGTRLITKETPYGGVDKLLAIPKERHFGRVVIKDQLDS